VLSQGVTPPAQAKPDGPQLPNQATKGSVRFMQANLDVIGPEMAMGDPVSAFWFASRCRTSGSRPARVTIRPDDTWRTTRASPRRREDHPSDPPNPGEVRPVVAFGRPARLRRRRPETTSHPGPSATARPVGERRTDSDRPARQQTERRGITPHRFPASSKLCRSKFHVRLHRRHECVIGRHPTFTILWCSFPPFIEPRR